MADFAQLATIQALAWALVHFLWQGTLIAVAAAVLLRVINTAGARYAIGVGALVVMLAVPVATFVVLDSRPDFAGAIGAADVSSQLPAPGSGAPVAQPGSNGPAVVDSSWWPAAGVLVWMAGVLILSVRLTGGWLVARRMATRAVRPAAAHVQAVAAALADQLALRRAVQVLESSAVAVPVLVGWLRPAIVFPVAALAGLSPAQIEALLAHELAHVRRHDYLVNLLQSFVEVVLFYHPAVWWLSRRVRIERELCCDDEAVGLCDRLVYATALTDLAAMRSPRVALAATGGDLLARVRRILGKEESPMSTRVRWMPAVVVAAAIVAAVPVLLASVRSAPVAAAADLQPAAPAAVSVENPPAPDSEALVEAAPQVEQQLSIEEIESLLAELRAKLAEADALRAFAVTPEEQQAPERLEQARRQLEERARAAEIDAARKNLERMRRMFEVGMATSAQVAEAEIAIARAEAGHDEKRLQSVEIDAIRRQLLDTRRRFEAGVVPREAIDELEAKLAQLQAMGDERKFMEVEIESAKRQADRMRALYERGLAPNDQFREAEKLFRDLEQRSKLLDSRRNKTSDNEEQKIKELFDEVLKRKGPDEQALRAQIQELEKALVERRSQSGELELRKREMTDLMAQYDRNRAEYERALSDRLQREVRREVPPEGRLRSDLRREVSPEANFESVPSRPIVAGDMLFITIDGESLLPEIYRIESNGTVRLPLLGSFKAIGLTPGQVREAIGKRLMDAKLGSPAKVRVELRRARER